MVERNFCIEAIAVLAHLYNQPERKVAKTDWRSKIMEEGYVGLSKSGSRHKRRQKDGNVTGEERKREDLELGLSLGAGSNAARGVGKSKSEEAISPYVTLSAKDSIEPRGLSRASSSSSSSSVADSDAPGSSNSPSQAVGWPPIGNFRISSLSDQSKDNTNSKKVESKKNLKPSNVKVELVYSHNQKYIDENSVSSPNFTRLVKVNMDGDPIGRKIDLNSHHSYESLALSLEEMFHKPTTCGLTSLDYRSKVSKLLDSSSEFVLTYEDRDGDWLLVGDVPWEAFLDSVKRLKIMRNSDASGTATGF